MDGKRNVAAAFYWASNFARMVNGLGRAKISGLPASLSIHGHFW